MTYCTAGNIGRKNIWRFWTALNIGIFNFGGYRRHSGLSHYDAIILVDHN